MRKLAQKKLLEVESSLRGVLRGFGLKVGKTTPVRFEGRIKELVTGHPSFHPEEAQCAALVPMGWRRSRDGHP